jgi:hypothetical protein
MEVIINADTRIFARLSGLCVDFEVRAQRRAQAAPAICSTGRKKDVRQRKEWLRDCPVSFQIITHLYDWLAYHRPDERFATFGVLLEF